MNKKIVYVHGLGGNASEAEHYKPLFPGCDVIGFDYRSQTPMEAKNEFRQYFDKIRGEEKIYVIANSLGAFFVLSSLSEKEADRAYFISPVTDMVRMISDIMRQAGVTENELRERGTAVTPTGNILSWEYYSYVKENPPKWNVPTHILYGSADNIVPFDTVSEFAGKTGSTLTVMENGEHWFHTDEEMRFLDEWIKSVG